MDGKHGRTTSGMTCHHRLWTAHTVERRLLWHAIIAFEQHTWSNDFGHGMTSPPLVYKHGRTMSGMTCHHRLWTAHTVERCRVWLYITALGLHAWSDDVGRGMTSPPLDSTQSRMTSGEACHHLLWAAHMVGLRRAWHDITALGQRTPSDDVGRGMTSPPLDSTHGWTTSGVE